MAIINKPKSKTPETFVAAAPDATKGVMKGRKRQITLTIAPGLLAKIDALAVELGQSRAGLVNLALRQAVERGVSFEGERERTQG